VAAARQYGMLVYPLEPDLADILAEIDAGHQQENFVQSLGLTFLFLLMLACILLMYLYRKIKVIHIIPESIIAIIIG
jgi:hypothetical protein